jgi:ferredoxin
MSLQLSIDPIGCRGEGLCAELLPQLITLDDWGYPILRHRQVPPELAAEAQRAADACPRIAIRLRKAEGAPAPPDRR